MNHITIRAILTIPIAIILATCEQIYDPQLADAKDAWVVEALMTDDAETYYVKLSHTIPYNSTLKDYPVTGAMVSVTDNTLNSTFFFTETRNGYYTFTADSNSNGVTGHSYTLQIVTPDGERFESSPEILTNTSEVDSVYGRQEVRNVMQESTNDGSKLYKKNDYLNILADIKGIESVSPGIRFRPVWLFEMVDYHEDCMGFGCPPPTYMWKYYEDERLSITGQTDNVVLREQLAGSVMIDYFKMLYNEQHLSYIVLILNSYHLSRNSYFFYKDVKDQLSADNSLFDPISTQIEGNIRCLSNPEKTVTGLFEVSFHETDVFLVIPFPIVVKPVNKLKGLPAEMEGFSAGNPPDWWIVN